MKPNRQDFESQEQELLAPYAALSGASRGRRFEEPEHGFRTAFQRDRDRVVHSTAFRRLEYKPQVFVNHEGDHYRTRLTHSLEAAQIARTIGDIQTLNAWMQTRDTRDVIMDPTATSLGFAWYQEPSGKIWWTLISGT